MGSDLMSTLVLLPDKPKTGKKEIERFEKRGNAHGIFEKCHNVQNYLDSECL